MWRMVCRPQSGMVFLMFKVKLLMSKNRRLAAIMFTDIAGFSAMMQADEAFARVILDRHRQVIDETHRRYGGEVLQFFGDGTLSIFDSAVSAVECAVDIQIDLRKEPEVPLRIGIHTGDISYDENGAFGDGVNVASRVENLCEKGGVYLTAKVYDDIKNHSWITASNLGSFNLRNIQAPMVIYAVNSKGLPVPSSRARPKGEPVRAESQESKVMEPVAMATDEEDLVQPIGIKKKKTAVGLAWGLGLWGVHKFYLGKKFAGVLHFILFIFSMIITVEEGIPMIAIYFGVVMVQAVLLSVMPQEDFDAKYNSGVLVKKRIKAKRKVTSTPKKDPVVNLMDRGLRKFKAKKYTQAINYFDHALDFDRDNGEAHFYLACCFSKTRAKNESMYHLGEALASGFINERDIQKEPTLRFVRNLAEFKEKGAMFTESTKALPPPQPDLLSSEFDPLILDRIEMLGERLGKGELTQQQFQLEKEKILRGE